MALGLVRTLLIDQSTFENCSGSNGGALCVTQGGITRSAAPGFTQPPLVISNSRFINSRAFSDGGAVAVQGVTANVHFTGCTFFNSTSTERWGGSVYLQSTEQNKIQVRFADCAFNHSAAVRGGAIFASFVQLTMTKTTFSHTYGELGWRIAATMQCGRSERMERVCFQHSLCDCLFFCSCLGACVRMHRQQPASMAVRSRQR